MKSVSPNEYYMEIKNSKFICQIFPIQKKEEVQAYLNAAKVKYPNATHYCYAYILGQEKRESDDGEPTGTAGIPMIQVLEKNELDHVLCIVIRYFGKIKLGAGGLVRAYTKCVVEALRNHIVTLEKGYKVQLTFDYTLLKNINFLLKGEIIQEKTFAEEITYQVLVRKEVFDTLQSFSGPLLEIKEEVYLPTPENN